MDADLPQIPVSEYPLSDPQDFYKIEDEFAKQSTHAQFESDFLKESEIVRKALDDIVNGSTEPLSEDLYIRISKMRRIGRLAQYATALNKSEVSNRLQQAEAQYLQLQNVNSEIQHLQKEISRCLQFRAGDDNIDLVNEDEFYSNAPESISNAEVTKTDEHAKHLARLSYELQQRKQLMGTLEEQEGRRSVLISDINGKEQRLKSLRPKIENLIAAAKPVQDVLDLGAEPG